MLRRRCRALAGVFVCVLALVIPAPGASAQATSAPVPGPVGVAAVRQKQSRTTARAAADGSDWLTHLNVYRRGAGLAALSENPAWTAGITHHNTYLAKTPASYRTGAYVSAHTENPASPYYTSDGADAAKSSNVITGAVGSTPVGMMNIWLAAPFHAIGILRPRLSEVAFALEQTSGNAGLDVIRGIDGDDTRSTPVLFPGPGTTTDLRSYSGSESPDPLETCGWAKGSARGLPLVVMLAGTPSASATASVTGPSGVAQTTQNGGLCLVDQHTYESSDTVYGPTGLAILKGDRAVLLITKEPLELGQQQVSLQQPGEKTIAWSFRTTTAAPTAAPVRTERVHVSNGSATVLGNLTATGGKASGYATAYACSSGRPTSSNVNFRPFETRPNFVVARSDENGDLCLYGNVPTDLVWDQVGTTTTFSVQDPVRLLDTRSGSRPQAGSVTRVHTGDGSATVLGNLTATQGAGDGFTTVYPCAAGRPRSSSSNFGTVGSAANFVAVASDDDGDVCIYVSAETHLIWDQVGRTTSFSVGNAERLLDTRAGAKPAAGSVTRVHTGDGAATVLANLTVTGAAGGGYTTVYPCTSSRPAASSSNYVTGQTVPNFVVARSDANGDLCVYTSGSTHLVWDQVGRTTSFAVGTPTRLLDTRITGRPATS